MSRLKSPVLLIGLFCLASINNGTAFAPLLGRHAGYTCKGKKMAAPPKLFGRLPIVGSFRGGSLRLSTDQNEIKHMIFELSPEEVKALETYSQECSLWKKGDKKPVFAYPELAKRMKQIYDEYGVVLVRGLVDESLLDQLIRAGNLLVGKEKSLVVSSFKAVEFGPVFAGHTVELSGEVNAIPPTDQDVMLSSFRTAAIKSAIPSCIGGILLDLASTLEDTSCGQMTNLRLLNDVFLAKGGKDADYCGWHIDDAVFWPCSPRHSPAGINSWIALDDIIAKYGGGMAVIPKSHTAEWSSDAQKAIGNTITHPSEGFSNIGELFQTIGKTCEIETNSPQLNDLMEKEGILFDFKKGDVLLMNRFTWHRSVQVTPEGNSYYSNCQGKSEDESPTLMRYTVRYEVGSVPLIRGASLHPGILYDPTNSGKPLDEVVASSGPFFPKAWPAIDINEMHQLHEMVNVKIPKAQKERERILAQMIRPATPAPTK